MKQNKNLVSSLLVALLAGFIYFQLGGVEDIKKIASFGYQLISNPHDEVTSTTIAANGKLIESNITEKETQTDLLTSEENQIDLEQSMKELADANQLSKYVSTKTDDYYTINLSTVANAFEIREDNFPVKSKYYIPKIINNQRNNLKSIRPHDYIENLDVIASVDDYYNVFTEVKICDDDAPITIIVDDSNFIKFDIEKLEFDKFNGKFDDAMEKLNIAIGKLTDNLKDMNYDFDNEENKMEFKLKIKEFESDMKEFEKEMKELDFEYNDDMNEFKEDMKEFKIEMKEFKKELKENLKKNVKEKYLEQEKCIDS